MRVLKTFQPGAPGTRRFAARFGKALVCVRYRHDPATGARLTTVELVVENTRVYFPRSKAGGSMGVTLRVKIGREEILLRQQITAAGGIWHYPEIVWEVTPEIVKKLRPRDRLVRTPGPVGESNHPPSVPDAYPWMPADAE